MVKKSFKTIKHPNSYKDVCSLKRKSKPGDILKDDTYACYWAISRREVQCISIKEGSSMRGNYPDESCFDMKLRSNISYLRSNDANLSTYGIFNQSDYDAVKRHALVNKNELNTNEKRSLRLLNKAMKCMDVTYFKTEQKNMEFGVELELESDDTISCDAREHLSNKNKDLIQDVGSDGSVCNGVEIRFKHPSMKGWKLDRIKTILDDAKEIGLKSEWGTAGMHIHISHKDIRKAIPKFIENLYEMETILYPIGCRKKQVGRGTLHKREYGVGRDLYRDQSSCFGTLEIRAWDATTNPDVFLARIRIAKALVEFLLTDLPVKADEFFRWLSKSRKKDYKFLMKTDNPHEYGLSDNIILSMMK